MSAEVDPSEKGRTSSRHQSRHVERRSPNEVVEALDISLSDSDVEYLEEPYHPVPVWSNW